MSKGAFVMMPLPRDYDSSPPLGSNDAASLFNKPIQ